MDTSNEAPCNIDKFRIEGPEPAEALSPTQEAEELEARASRTADPEEAARFRKAAEVFRWIGECPDAGELSGSADVYFEEAELRLKALAALRGKAVVAELSERVLLKNHIDRLEAEALSGGTEDKQKAAMALFETAHNATCALRNVTEKEPELIRPIVAGSKFFPVLSDGRKTETKEAVKARKDALKNIGLGDELTPDNRRSDMNKLCHSIVAWIRLTEEKIADRRELDLSRHEIEDIFEGFDSRSAKKNDWLRVAKAVLRWSYDSSSQGMPRIEGGNWNSAYEKATETREAIRKKWEGRNSIWGKPLLPKLLPPTAEKVAKYEHELSRALDTPEWNEYFEDGRKFDEAGSQEAIANSEFEEFLNQFSDFFRDRFTL